LRRKHGIPSGGAEYFLEEAMPDRRFAMVYFNDHRCRSLAELRSTIVKARDLALRDAERDRAAAAVERWLLAELEKDLAAREAAGDYRVTLSCAPPTSGLRPPVARSLVPSTTTGRP
jgi:hypothetical protein